MTSTPLRLRPGQPFPPRLDTIIVIDVLRMTTTAAVLMRRPGATRVAVAATLDDLPGLSLPEAACVVVSELVSTAWPGAWVDNSPARVTDFPFGERTPVLVTTNGTRALLAAAACAERVLLASFVDLAVVARYLRDAAPSSVALLPAGHFATGERRTEDDLCADALTRLLGGGEPDLAASSEAVRADARVRRRILAEPGFSADVDAALRPAEDASVMIFEARGLGVGFITRAAAVVPLDPREGCT